MVNSICWTEFGFAANFFSDRVIIKMGPTLIIAGFFYKVAFKIYYY